MNITEKYMIVRLSISQWTARKLDRKATEKIISEFNAGEDAGRFNKLLVDREAIKRIEQAAREITTIHKTMSLPWQDEGARILPAALYLTYTARIQKAKARFTEEVAVFINRYSDLVREAKVKLNGLFDESDYPSVDVLKRKYRAEIDVDAVPKAEDFRVNLSDEETKRIRQEIEDRVNHRINEAMKSAFQQLHDAASKIAEKCKETDAIFRDSMIENLRELLDVLPSLNITNDPELTKAIEAAKPLAEIEPQDLRDDADSRNKTAKKAAALANKLKGFL